MADLERDMGNLQQGIKDNLAKLGSGPAEAADRPQQPATSRPSALRTSTRDKAPPPPRDLAGLDPAVVQAARAAGVPDSHLQEMARVVQGSSSKLKDLPAPAKAIWAPPTSLAALDQTDDEPEEETADEAQVQGGDRMAAVIEKLTVIATTLEGLLEAGGATDTSGSAGASRRNSAALRVLKRALRDHPRELADGMLERMAADFGLARALPGGDRVPVTARAWVESRARIQHHYPSTVRFAWILAGVVDALGRGDYDERLAPSLGGAGCCGATELGQGQLDTGGADVAGGACSSEQLLWKADANGERAALHALARCQDDRAAGLPGEGGRRVLRETKEAGKSRTLAPTSARRHEDATGQQGRQRQAEGQAEGCRGQGRASMSGHRHKTQPVCTVQHG